MIKVDAEALKDNGEAFLHKICMSPHKFAYEPKVGVAKIENFGKEFRF